MRWIAAPDVMRLLSPGEAIACVRAVTEAARDGRAEGGPRRAFGPTGPSLLLMPASVPGALGLKAITFADDNRARGLPTIQGMVIVFDPQDGRLLGACDGPSLTAARTAAIAGYATDILASPEAHTLLLAGAGAQAAAQVAAVVEVRPIDRVLLWNRTKDRAEELARSLRTWRPQLRVETVDDLAAGCRQADVITLVTAAPSPLIQLADVPPGCHVNAMGSYHPDQREVASDLVAHSVVFADTLEGCREEAGDLLIPIAEGVLRWEQVEPLAAATPNLRSQRTLLKSVGSAIFDLSCALRLLQLSEAGDADGEFAAWPIPI